MNNPDVSLQNPPLPFQSFADVRSEDMQVLGPASAQQKASQGYEVLHRGRPEIPLGYAVPVRQPGGSPRKEP